MAAKVRTPQVWLEEGKKANSNAGTSDDMYVPLGSIDHNTLASLCVEGSAGSLPIQDTSTSLVGQYSETGFVAIMVANIKRIIALFRHPAQSAVHYHDLYGRRIRRQRFARTRAA